MPDSPSFLFRFGAFELDPARFELREDGASKHVEPQVLSLLILLAGNADRLVSKDEIIEKVWGGRFISDAAVASRIKAARQAVGDDGEQQRFIRTVHGKGFRFAAEVAVERVPETIFAQAAVGHRGALAVPDERPSIAVLPFRAIGAPGPLSFAAEALADELIVDLSRLRWLMVIARASSFRFRGRDAGCQEVGAVLGVRYCLSGTLEQVRGGVNLSVELAGTADGAVIWAERFSAGRDELDAMRHEILAAIVANLEARIAQSEVQLARRLPQAQLGPWSAYHLGLDHMFRFNRADNARAAALFEQALGADPEFSRALSGLSFTRFQDGFLQYSGRREEMTREARALAERAIRADPLDPFAHLNLGRALWFEDGIAESIERLGHCIALSPNYAQAVYSKAWAEMTLGEAAQSDENAALALTLSPLDPLRYAMLAVRSVNALVRGDEQAAADLGERAARSPGAHKLVVLIAALGTQAAGRTDRSAQWMHRARELDPQISREMFLRSFPFAPSAGRELIERTLGELRL
ncbi:MAG TPA: winged helix-turn-helix domain-containing protein [Croceibacterium sp.]|nr:winged helix-turn-helix domain-containing protein [Croceibacterium sp.]